nr:MAG TPA: hypothetical protein [Caudoviricetes sp.]
MGHPARTCHNNNLSIQVIPSPASRLMVGGFLLF